MMEIRRFSLQLLIVGDILAVSLGLSLGLSSSYAKSVVGVTFDFSRFKKLTNGVQLAFNGSPIHLSKFVVQQKDVNKLKRFLRGRSMEDRLYVAAKVAGIRKMIAKAQGRTMTTFALEDLQNAEKHIVIRPKDVDHIELILKQEPEMLKLDSPAPAVDWFELLRIKGPLSKLPFAKSKVRVKRRARVKRSTSDYYSAEYDEALDDYSYEDFEDEYEGSFSGSAGSESGSFGSHSGSSGSHSGSFGSRSGLRRSLSRLFGSESGSFGSHSGSFGSHSGSFGSESGPDGSHSGLEGSHSGLVGSHSGSTGYESGSDEIFESGSDEEFESRILASHLGLGRSHSRFGGSYSGSDGSDSGLSGSHSGSVGSHSGSVGSKSRSAGSDSGSSEFYSGLGGSNPGSKGSEPASQGSHSGSDGSDCESEGSDSGPEEESDEEWDLESTELEHEFEEYWKKQNEEKSEKIKKLQKMKKLYQGLANKMKH